MAYIDNSSLKWTTQGKEDANRLGVWLWLLRFTAIIAAFVLFNLDGFSSPLVSVWFAFMSIGLIALWVIFDGLWRVVEFIDKRFKWSIRVNAGKRYEWQDRFWRNAIETMPPGHYVYLLYETYAGCYKIGHTRNPSRRIYDFNVKLPIKFQVLAVIKCDDMYALESELHTRFARNRVDGEWFTLTDDDVRYIHALAEAA